MIIAMSQRVLENSTYPDRRDALSHDWVCAFARRFPEATLAPIPNRLADVRAWVDALRPDGIVLSGGNDWGDAKERDATETALYGLAVEREMPLLGVCRGLQVIHKLTGGEIETSLAAATGVSHTAVRHPVRIAPGPFREIAGCDEFEVNSFHDQGVRLSAGVAPQLYVFATAGDCVEGFAHRTKPVLAMQWHPERDGAPTRFDFTIIRKLFYQKTFWASGLNGGN